MVGKDTKIEDSFLEVDYENGLIIRRPNGSRVVVMGSLGWAMLEHELVSTFVTGAAVILQRMGYSYGRYLGRVAKARKSMPVDLFETMLSFSKREGWGKLSLNGGDLNTGDARIVVRGCFFCLHWKDSKTPVCHMLAGLIAGITDEISGETHRVLEERCIGRGDNVCEILVEKVH